MRSESQHAEIIALRAENEALVKRALLAEKEALLYREKLAKSEQRIALLEHELGQLKRLVYSTKSERFVPALTPDQLLLFGAATPEAEEPAPREAVAYERSKARRPSRNDLPAELPRKVVVIEPDVDVAGLRKIGELITETLDYRPPRYLVIQRVRPKYVDPSDADRGVIVAALPPRAVEKGIAEPGLLAQVVTEKYVDHLPIYRQVQRLKREGVRLATSTVEGWVSASADLLGPVYEALKKEVLESTYIQADETPIPVQDPAKKGKTHRGYYWVYNAPAEGLVFMEYQQGRGRDGPRQLLGSFKGALQSDGYGVYDAFDDFPGITTYACWAHARRHFFEARENAPALAEHALGEIRSLYEIERFVRETDPSPENRRRVRLERSLPILERFKPWLQANRGLPKSPFGQAVFYALARWDKLTRYAGDGHIEIDNNFCENAIRPIALVRRNYLFAGSHAAAQRAAIIYSLLATCKKHDVHPRDWMSDVLSRIPVHPHKRVHELLPHRWESAASNDLAASVHLLASQPEAWINGR
jgi:transposase